MNITKKLGFTLTELLVVVVVMAVLVAIGVPLYKKTIDRSRASDAIHVLETVAAKQEAVWVETGKYAPNFSQLAAPVKGLNTAGEAKIGNYTYTMEKACAAASHGDKYTIYKNFITQESGCTGSGCDLVKGLVEEGSVNCEYTIPDGGGETEVPPAPGDTCDLNPAACCPAGTNWTGSACVRCNFPKVWNNAAKQCVCGNLCGGGNAPDELTCACPCTNTCTGGKELGPDCNCYCPPGKPNWDGSKCVGACAAPKTRWNEDTASCDCPLGYPIYMASENKCISGCVPPQVWNGVSCVCGDETRQAKNNCIATGGSWSESTCSCVCNSPRTTYTTLGCVCPEPKNRFTGSSCECPLDRPLYHPGSNTCVVPCNNPQEWNFESLRCECPASFNAKMETCLSTGGKWNADTCSCVCTLPKELNASSGACECFPPRTYWTGTTCECPLNNPNWNATNKTCNPACTDPKLYWDGTQCICQPDKPKYVAEYKPPKLTAVVNQCCLESQGSACGGGVPNSIAGVKPCVGNTCDCSTDTVLSGGSCCALATPFYINQSWGCCKTANAATACGSGIPNSDATGLIACDTAQCSSCTGKYPSLREDASSPGTKYCCLGSCNFGNFVGTGSNTCNCECYVGYRLNAGTGNCESCGVCENCEWTDNKCNYSCKEGYCRDGSGKCQKIPVGQYRSSNGEKCTACTGLRADAAWTGPGTTTADSCPWECNSGKCFNEGENVCKTIPVGQWRDGNDCTNCTGKPENNSVYTDSGGTTNSCPWLCDPITTCHNGTDCVPIAVGQWRAASGACDNCWKPVNSDFTSPGDDTGVNSCKWWCHGAYCQENNNCTRTTIEKFRGADTNCIDCASINQCWDHATLTCKATTADIKRNTTTGLCTTCTTAQGCWNASDNSCVQPVGQYRDGSGFCAACTNGGAVLPAVKNYTSYGNANNTCNINCTPAMTTCLDGANITTGSCISIPNGKWRDGILCKACNNTRPSGSSYDSNGGTGNGCSWRCDGAVQCAMSVSGSCAAPGKEYYTDDNKLCKACSNTKPSGSSYTVSGGTTNNCAWKCPTGQCAPTLNGTCAAPAKTHYSDDNTICKACTNPKPSNATYTASGGASNNCDWQCPTGQCSEDGTSACAAPKAGWRNTTNKMCTKCTDTLPTGATFTTPNSCAWSCGAGKCSVNGSPCANTPLNYTQGDNSFCVACTNSIPGGSTRVNPNDCNTWICPVGQCSADGYAACGTPANGFYTDDRKTCKACTNGPIDRDNFTYTGQGNGQNKCPFFPKDGFCLWENDTRATAYYNQTGNTSHWRDSAGRCVTCANKPSGASYTSHGTSADCPWKCPTNQCSINGTGACGALKAGYLNTGGDKICAACPAGSIPPGATHTTPGNCSLYGCPSGQCSTNGGACAAPGPGYTNPSNTVCSGCGAIPSGASFFAGGTCDWQCPAGQCSNGGAACGAPPTGKYVPANRQYCQACTNAKPAGSNYTGNGGTSNNCAWTCTTGCSINGTGACGNHNGYTNSSGNKVCTACGSVPSGSTWTAANDCNAWTCGAGKCSVNGTGACAAPPVNYTNTTNKVCTACSNAIPSGSTRTVGGDCNSWVCSAGRCSRNGTEACGQYTGYYTTTNKLCTACTNGPDASGTYDYTGTGGASNSCGFKPKDGYCLWHDGKKIQTSYYYSFTNTTAYWRDASYYCQNCTNKPANSYYTGYNLNANNCPWACNNGYKKQASDNTCQVCLAGETRNNTPCTAGCGQNYETCQVVAGGANYWKVVNTCTNPSCGVPNSQSNPTYRYVDQKENTCASEGFPCPTTGKRYYYKQQVCTCSGWAYTTGSYILYKDDCTRPNCDGTAVGGTRTYYEYAKCSATDANLCGDNVSTDRRRGISQRCDCNGSTAQWVNTSGWTAWSNYSTNCTAKSCNQATVQACGTNNNGTQYRSCSAASCSGGTYTAWGQCNCGAGWCGANCTVNTNQYCSTPGSVVSLPFHSKCNGNGTLKQTCVAGCPNSYTEACECAKGYTGTYCDSAPATHTTTTKPARVGCSYGSASRWYSAYESITSRFEPGTICQAVSNGSGHCLLTHSAVDGHTEYVGTGYITGTMCGVGKSAATICAENALGYKCILPSSVSTTDSCGSTYMTRYCDCTNNGGILQYSEQLATAALAPIIDQCNYYCRYEGSAYTNYTGSTRNVQVVQCGGAECPAMADGTGKTEVDYANCRQRTCNASTLRWGSYTTTLGTDQCCSAQVTSTYKPSKSCGRCGKQFCNSTGNTYGTCTNPECCYGDTSSSGCLIGYEKTCNVYNSSTGFYSYSACKAIPGCSYGGTFYRVGQIRTQLCSCYECMSNGNWKSVSSNMCPMEIGCGGLEPCLRPPCLIERPIEIY